MISYEHRLPSILICGNLCLKAFIERGIIKARNFKNSHYKQACIYLLTAKGINGKTKITARFLKRKLMEFDELKNGIDNFRYETMLKENTHFK